MRPQVLPAVAILAGGASSRMGADKAALEIAGEPLLRRTVRLASTWGTPVAVVGRARPHDWPRELEVSWLEDDEPGVGPLGGLLAALKWSPLPRVLLLPCDMPLLESSALQWLASEASTCGARDGLAATRGGELEPLFSVYFADVEEAARERLASGRRSLRGLIERGDFARAECPADVARQIFNCNTPEDWRAARGV